MDEQISVKDNLKTDFNVLAVRQLNDPLEVDLILNKSSDKRKEVQVAKENIEKVDETQPEYSDQGQVNFHLKIKIIGS